MSGPVLPEHDDETAFWRAARAGADRPQNLDALPDGAPPPRERIANADYVAAVRRVALKVACRDCNAPIDVVCHYVGEPDRPLRRFPAHQHRIDDAKKAGFQ